MLLDDGLNHLSLVVMYIGLAGFLTSAFLFIYKGFDRKGRYKFKQGLTWMLMSCFFVVVYVTGLTFLGRV